MLSLHGGCAIGQDRSTGFLSRLIGVMGPVMLHGPGRHMMRGSALLLDTLVGHRL